MVEKSTEPGERTDGETETTPQDQSRRTFLIRSIAVVGGFITVSIAWPAAAFVTGSARSSADEDTWIRLGPASSIEPGGPPTLMRATVSRRSGYLVEETEVSVFVTSDDGVDFTILSNVCTHLGCRVRWVDDQEQFFCPCHNAIFDERGAVVQGPPPRPLDRFEYMIEDGNLFFKENQIG
jgi:menaquinol-cytochrome c reductase iron-sulfur subunit